MLQQKKAEVKPPETKDLDWKKQEIFRLMREKKQQNDYEEVLTSLRHHALMRVYGWIPLEEFKKLPITTVNNLLVHITEDAEKEKEAYEKANKKKPRVR